MQLSRLETADLIVLSKELEKGRNEASKQEIARKRAKKRMDQFLEEQAEYIESLDIALPEPLESLPSSSNNPVNHDTRKQNILRFFTSPVAFLPDPNTGKVAGVEVEITDLKGEPENQKAVSTGAKEVCGIPFLLDLLFYALISPIKKYPNIAFSFAVKVSFLFFIGCRSFPLAWY